MSAEKLAILKMLEDKKITADEAAKLLESAGKVDAVPVKKSDVPVLIAPEYSEAFTFAMPSAKEVPKLIIPPPISYDDPPEENIEPSAERAPDKPEIDASRDPRSASDAHGAADPRAARPPVYGESLAEEMGRKLGRFMRQMEPKLQKLAGTIAGKTVDAADAMSHAASARQASAPTASSSAGTGPSIARGGVEKMFEINVAEQGSELSLSGLNGNVLVRGYNGDKISAKVYYVSKHGGARIDLVALGSKYYLDYDESDFTSVCIDAFVPEKRFGDVRLSATNGALTVSMLTTDNVKLESLNGKTELSGLITKNLLVECSNGALHLGDIAAANAAIENFNAPISAVNTDVAQMKMSTINGSISLRMADFRCFDEYDWEMEASNAKMSVALPASAALGYSIRAAAALGAVKLRQSGLYFKRDERSFAEAQSVRYDAAEKKVRLNLATSNALLEVN